MSVVCCILASATKGGRLTHEVCSKVAPHTTSLLRTCSCGLLMSHTTHVQMARRLRSAAARRREARFCGWLARGLWVGLHVAIIAVTLSANHGVAARIRRDMPYAASLAGVLSANVALFLYLCAADPGYIAVTDRRLGGSKQAALGGAMLRRSCRRPAPVRKLAGADRRTADTDTASLPVRQLPDPEPRARGHHMLASASMLFESSFPDQVMQPAAEPVAPSPPQPSSAGHGPSASALAAQQGPVAPYEATDHMRHCQHRMDLVSVMSAPAATRGHDIKFAARQPQLAPPVRSNNMYSQARHAARRSTTTLHSPTIDSVAESCNGDGDATALSNGHLLSSYGKADVEEQPLLPLPETGEFCLTMNRGRAPHCVGAAMRRAV